MNYNIKMLRIQTCLLQSSQKVNTVTDIKRFQLILNLRWLNTDRCESKEISIIALQSETAMVENSGK